MKKLITVADDFAFTSGITTGCIEAVNDGMLQELSLMMDSPHTKQGAKKAMANNIQNVGIHITLNDIVDTGIYMRTNDYKQLLEYTDSKKLSSRVKDEFSRFEDLLGRVPTHINGHQNCCLHPKVIDTVIEYALKHDLYIRKPSRLKGGNPGAGGDVKKILMDSNAKVTDHIFEYILGSYDEAYNGFLADLEKIGDDSITEIFFHPGYVDDELRSYTSLLEERQRDIKLLKDKSFKAKIEEMGFVITGF